MKIGEVICSPVNFEPDPTYDDWETYEAMRKGSHCNSISEVCDGWYSIMGDARVDYIAPSRTVLKDYPNDVNNNSLVLRINCRGHNLIIPGDMEEAGWSYVDNGKIKNTTLLLASHHGNKSGHHSEKTKQKNPTFIVISAGKKTEHDADERYRNHATKGLYTTRQKRIVARIDDQNTLHMID